MFRGIYAVFFMSMLVVMPVSSAKAANDVSLQNAPSEDTFDKDEKGFSYELAGDAEEEGALKLFVMNATSEHEIFDINADDLNRIAPAAGIKLQFEF